MSRLASIASISTALALTACGGGGGSSSGSSPAALRVTRGAITARSAGTVTVNGVKLSTTSAAVRADGKGVPETLLAKGMVVTVKGTFDDRGGEAAEVEAEHAVEGQVDDKGADFVVIGGQRVHVDGSTEHDAGHPAGLDSVAVGEVIAVSGVADDRGGVRASRIDGSPRESGPASGRDDLDLQGFVSGFVAGTSFELRISPDASDHFLVLVGGLTLPAGFRDGARVEVHALAKPTAGTPPLLGTIAASSVELEDHLAAPDARGELELEGIVTSGSAASFVIDGVTVVTDGATRWELGAASELVPGAKVEAEGQVDAAGVLHAEKVAFRAGVRISATVSGYDGVASLTLLGVPVSIPSFARIDPTLVLADGLAVEVRGALDASGIGIVALRIDPASGSGGGRPFVRAVATAKSSATAAAPSFTVLGFDVTTAGASFRGLQEELLTAEVFFAAVEPGRTVIKVRAASPADVSGTAFAADELELEGND